MMNKTTSLKGPLGPLGARFKAQRSLWMPGTVVVGSLTPGSFQVFFYKGINSPIVV